MKPVKPSSKAIFIGSDAEPPAVVSVFPCAPEVEVPPTSAVSPFPHAAATPTVRANTIINNTRILIASPHVLSRCTGQPARVSTDQPQPLG